VAEQRPDLLLAEAEAAVAAFVAHRPAYAVDATQPAYRGGTNRVTLGTRAGAPVVLKYFVQDRRWRHELACLRHLAPSGLVPRVLEAVPPRLLVLERLPGRDPTPEALRALTPAQTGALSREVGAALAALVAIPLPAGPDPTDGYDLVRDFDPALWGDDLRAVVARILAPCRRLQRTVPAYCDPFFARSLALLEAQLPALDRARRVLFHEDVANLRVAGARFRGFYDLEMCRVGTAAMQLGVALGLCGAGGLDWPALAAGYGAATGAVLTPDDALAALAMHHFHHWTRIGWWGRWDGDPTVPARWRAALEAAPARERSMRASCRVLRHLAPVAAWFGDGGTG
jgi:hypothetical protein